MSLLDKLVKANSVKNAFLLDESPYFNKKDVIPTDLPILNVAFSGTLDGGLVSGLTVIAGESKSFKTLLSLYCLKAYFDKYPDAICLFYDSEFGVTPTYLRQFNIDPSRIIQIPLEHIEQLKFDIAKRLEAIERNDKVFILIDSVGNLASKKEVDDALNENTAADMTRAKQLKSLFRIVTPHLTMKNIPMVAIAHTYKTQELYSKDIISGGCVIAGTNIQTPTGLKKVEDFIVGDFVNTLSGPMPVTHIWNPDTLDEGTPECYEITFEDGYTVTVSENHKFLIDGKWVEAKNLAEDFVCSIINP